MSAADFNAALLASPEFAKRSAKSSAPKRSSPEETLHRQVFDWVFKMQAVFPLLQYMLHVPNGGARSKGEAGKLKAMGVRKGVSDVINPFQSGPWKGFAVELKAPNGKCTLEQEEFLDKAKCDGWLTGVCYTLEEFINLAQSYLGTRVGSLSAKRANASFIP